MLKITTNIQGLDKLQNEIDKLERLIKLQNNNELNKYLKNKVWQTLQDVMNRKLTNGTTNDDLIEEYRIRNKIVDTTNGFVLYNDFVLPEILTVGSNGRSNYSKGFSIALAFEYGVGITGEGTYDKGTSTFTPWEYNVNDYNFGWYYKDNQGKLQHTYGYEGFQIYRSVVDEVNRNLKQWIKEYKNRKEV